MTRLDDQEQTFLISAIHLVKIFPLKHRLFNLKTITRHVLKPN